MAQGTRKTPWEHFMTAASACDRINRKDRTRAPRILSLKEQIERAERIAEHERVRVKPAVEEPVTYSHASDALTMENWKSR